MVPKPFLGTELIPLNDMDKESSLYKGHAKKYVGRENLTEQSIPLLNCLWNDVVQFSALDPQLIVDKLKVIQPDFQLFRREYFKVSVEEVESIYEGVLFDRRNSSKKTYEIFPDEVKILNKENYIELDKVPDETINFWKNAIEEKRPVLWFPYITHVFLKGRVDTSSFEICTIDL
jgi:hypothetical protein